MAPLTRGHFFVWGACVLSTPEADYDLFQEDIILRLKDRGWFIECMAYNIIFVGRGYGCHVSISRTRLGEAYDYWVEDTHRTLKDGMPEGTEELDHFKHASFISFWLRRRLPINRIRFLVSLGDLHAEKFTQDQTFFRTYAGEISAFSIGLKICLFYHCNIIEQAGNQEGSGANMVTPLHEDLRSYLGSYRIRKNFLADTVMILKHKNVSPHGLYLLYRALFPSEPAI